MSVRIKDLKGMINIDHYRLEVEGTGRSYFLGIPNREEDGSWFVLVDKENRENQTEIQGKQFMDYVEDGNEILFGKKWGEAEEIKMEVNRVDEDMEMIYLTFL